MVDMLGQMNTRVEIQQAQKTPDALGGNSYTWHRYALAYAETLAPRTRERYLGAAIENTLTVAFRIHWRRDLLPDMRVVASGVTYEIIGMHHIGQREWTILDCVEASGG